MQPIIHKMLRKDKKKAGKVPVILQVYFNKKRTQIFTGLTIEESDWDDVKKEAKAKMPNSTWFNQLLRTKLQEVEGNYLKQLLESGNIDIKGKAKPSRINFFEFAYQMYDGMKNRCKQDYIERSKHAIRSFEGFAGSVNFQGITTQLLKRYEEHLFAIGLQRNTINRIFKRIKQVFSQAIKEGLTTDSPFTHYRAVTYKQTKRNYLTIEQIKQIEALELPEDLEYIRNYFLLSCYTGLRFSDVQNFDKSKAVIKSNNIERIIIGTTKTGEVVSIKLTKNVKSIVEKIDRPLPSNVHTNRMLKIIGQKAKIHIPLTYHLSRHSFSVNCASLGFPIEAVAKLLGHSNIRTTAIYYKVVDTKIDEYMDRWD